MTIRAVPGTKNASVVIHLVDWSVDAEAFSVSLRHRLFGHHDRKTMPIVLHVPGSSPVVVTPMAVDGEWTTFRLPRLRPYGVVVVTPGES